MIETCTIIAINTSILPPDNITIRHNMPKHKGMILNHPWLYIDQNNIKYYCEWFDSINNIYVVVAR